MEWTATKAQLRMKLRTSIEKFWLAISLALISLKILVSLFTPPTFDLVTVVAGVIRQENFCLCSPWQAIYFTLSNLLSLSDIRDFREIYLAAPWTLQPSILLIRLGLKMPFLLVDGLIGYLIMKLASSTVDAKAGKFALVVWLFNPYSTFLFEGSTAFDILPSALVVLATLLVIKNRSMLSAFALAGAAYTKLFPVLLTPIVALAAHHKRRLGGSLCYLLTLLGVAGYFYWLQQAGVNILQSLLVPSPLTQAFPEFILSTSETRIGLAMFGASMFYLWLLRRRTLAPKQTPLIEIAFLTLFLGFLNFELAFTAWVIPLVTLDFVAARNLRIATSWTFTAFLLGFFRTQGYATPSGYSLLMFPLVGARTPNMLTDLVITLLASPFTPVLIEPIIRTVFTALSLVYTLEITKVMVGDR